MQLKTQTGTSGKLPTASPDHGVDVNMHLLPSHFEFKHFEIFALDFTSKTTLRI